MQHEPMISTVKNGKKIYNWIIRNHPPTAWHLIAVKIGDQFVQNNVDPFLIKDTTEFDDHLVQRIDQLLKNHYNTGIPDYLYN